MFYRSVISFILMALVIMSLSVKAEESKRVNSKEDSAKAVKKQMVIADSTAKSVGVKEKSFKRGDSIAVFKGEVLDDILKPSDVPPLGVVVSNGWYIDFKHGKYIDVMFTYRKEKVKLEDICSVSEFRLLEARKDSAKAVRDSIVRAKKSEKENFKVGDTVVVADRDLSVKMGNPPSDPPAGIVLTPGTFVEDGVKKVKVRFETMSGSNFDRVIEQDKLRKLNKNPFGEYHGWIPP